MSIEKLENNIGEKRKASSVKTIYLASGLLILGLATVFVSAKFFTGGSAEISADVVTPPTPTDPEAALTPPIPDDPTDQDGDDGDDSQGTIGQIDDDTWAFPSGWSMINGSFLQNKEMDSFQEAGLILYSFNDSAYPNRQWTTFPLGETSRTDLQNIVPMSPFGYYVYNPGSDTATVDFVATQSNLSQDKIVARGWHLMYWPNTVATKDQLLSKIQLKYQDGTVLTAKEAIESKYHRASIKLYSIANENIVDKSSAIEDMDDVQVRVFSMPPRSYFWLYLRRTKDRVVDISIAD
ncbi:MAG: hypothetical protein BWY43_00325 [candidate division WS2 bacterium ADurb.Bin280]|uniref:Uncharacterized protein n=1 Tax=candidate division WS2 bacterium ADurb.Bin280 TaxID=1852829 RepID=A0A1V5SEA1_9BACT|nr:MAG: hypothetical protein BWY43_00325 [candidate division WS2 bacterium ADurb.Bin280]